MLLTGALAFTPGAESADAPISPRPVPTGKMHRNMHILNSIVRTIGKTAAYIDVDEANESHLKALNMLLRRCYCGRSQHGRGGAEPWCNTNVQGRGKFFQGSLECSI